jgi:hypothetical protein
MSKMSEVRAQLEKQAKPPEPRAQSKNSTAKGRDGKIHIGAYLDPAFRKSLRMVQAQTDSDMQELLAQALNDLFRKHNVPVIGQD